MTYLNSFLCKENTLCLNQNHFFDKSIKYMIEQIKKTLKF